MVMCLKRKWMLRAVALIPFLVIVPIQADPQYRIYEGKPWSGVLVGNQPPKTNEIICKDTNCVPLAERSDSLAYITFEGVAKLVGVTRQGDQLLLPQELGFELYMASEREDFVKRIE